jgi:hypothetical protein
MPYFYQTGELWNSAYSVSESLPWRRGGYGLTAVEEAQFTFVGLILWHHAGLID